MYLERPEGLEPLCQTKGPRESLARGAILFGPQNKLNFLLILAHFTLSCTTVPGMHCSVMCVPTTSPPTIYGTAAQKQNKKRKTI